LALRYVRHKRDLGKGAAINEAAGEYVITQDGDREYDPERVSLLLKPVLRETADVV